MLSNFLKLSYFGDNVSSDCGICLFNLELIYFPCIEDEAGYREQHKHYHPCKNNFLPCQYKLSYQQQCYSWYPDSSYCHQMAASTYSSETQLCDVKLRGDFENSCFLR